jgi:folate-binding protein YgfZ
MSPVTVNAADASHAARTGALLVAQDERGTLLVTGPERASWLNGLLTCDVAALGQGTGAFGLALTKQGKILSDVDVACGADSIFLSVAPRTAESLYAVLDRFLIMEDAELAEISDRFAWLALHGPRAVEFATQAAPRHGARAAAIDWTGLGGAALVVPRTEYAALWADLVRVGGDALCAASDEQWRALRVERLLPAFGVDYDDRDNPHEASLDHRAVSWTKGCYLGQEVVCMQDMRGKVKRRLVALVLDEGGAAPERGAAVQTAENGEVVGEVTSGALSGELEKPVALARMQSAFAEPCATLRVAGRAGHVIEAPV